MKLEKLLPCPFCGDAAPDIFQAGANLLWYITCQDTDCMCSFNSIRRENVIAAWNTRAKASAASTPPEGKVLRAERIEQALLRMVQSFDHQDARTNHRDLLEAKENALAFARQALAAPAPAPRQVTHICEACDMEWHTGKAVAEGHTCEKAPAPACKTCGGSKWVVHPVWGKPCPDCNAGEGEL